MHCANAITMRRITATPTGSGTTARRSAPTMTANPRRQPILGQLLSADVTDTLVVVVRYFGGTKLGVPGLIQAYRESTAAVLEHSTIVRRTVDCTFEVAFSYTAMNDIMRIVKDAAAHSRTEVRQSVFDASGDTLLACRTARGTVVRCRGRDGRANLTKPIYNVTR